MAEIDGKRRFMRSSDAFSWSMEADPRLRSTIVTLVVTERSPDWDAVVHRFDLLTRTVPSFRWRVLESPPPAPPRWETDPDFDLNFHVRRLSAGPDGMAGVLQMCRVAAMESFDLARPLWQVEMVDGLPGGAAAMIVKLHHALTDGVGGVQLAMTLFELAPEGCRPELPDVPSLRQPTRWDDLRDGVRYNSKLARRLATGAVRTAPRALGALVRNPVSAVREAAATGASVYRTVRPVMKTGSALMTERSLVRAVSTHTVSLPRLRSAAHAVDVALNDAFVAGVAGGLRRYHERHGVSVDELHLTMPISLRTDDDGPGGNRITLQRFDIPVGEADPALRMVEIHRRVAQVRAERSLPLTQLIAGALNLLPRFVLGEVLLHVDVLASDVPGVPVPVYLGGAAVTEQYAFGPTIGSAVNVTLLSYVDTCAFGVDVDTAAISDPEVFHACLVEGFDEVLALGQPPA